MDYGGGKHRYIKLRGILETVMKTKQQIIAKYKKQHDELSQAYYTGTSGLTKEEFDRQHGQNWDNMDAKLAELELKDA